MTLTLPSRTEVVVTPARRRRVVGIDVWIEAPAGADVLEPARRAADRTHLRLVTAIDDAGEPVVAPLPEADVIRVRFVARDDEVHLTDEAIAELLLPLGRALRWSTSMKLEEFDGVPAFVPLPVA